MKYIYTLPNGRQLDKRAFCRYFESKVLKVIRKFGLIRKQDKIAVSCSGGKDSTVALHVLNHFCTQRRQQLIAIAVDEGIRGYRNKLLEDLKKFCKKEKIKLNIYSFKKEYGFTLDKIVNKIAKIELSNCYVCSILKRWLVNKKARQLGCTVIATGHSLDDEAETILLNQFKGNAELLAKLGPLVGLARTSAFVQRIKPLYLCTEKEIILYCRLNSLPLHLGYCPRRGRSFRVEVREILNNLEKRYPDVKRAVVASLLALLPILKKRYKEKEFRKCKRCKEAASVELCKRCEILHWLKK